MHYFFTSILQSIKQSFTRYYGLPHVVACLGTYGIVISNVDWQYFVNTRTFFLLDFFRPAIYIGGLVPLVIPITLIVFGYIFTEKRSMVLGWALAQAMILGSFISSTYKTFTGRIQPNLHDFVTNNSHAFNFGFYEHGIFWGWPSSHTTIAFAMAFTSIMIFRKSRTVFIFSVMYAFYIGIGVSLFIHWFSDFFAGAIIGTVIGIVVGGHFRQQFESKNTGLIVS